MRKLKWWLLGLTAVFAGGLPALGKRGRSDNVKARLISETDAIAPGQSIWVALEFSIRDGWQPIGATRVIRAGDQIGLDAARRINGGRHRLDHTASLRDPAPGQLRLRQARDASGQDHGAQDLKAARRSRSRPRPAGWSAPTSASPKAPTCELQAAGEDGPRRRRSRRRRALFTAARSELPSRLARADRRAIRTASWC